MDRITAAARITVFGAIGMALMLGLFLVGQHLWVDHTNLHALVNLELQREQQMGVAGSSAKAPAPPVTH